MYYLLVVIFYLIGPGAIYIYSTEDNGTSWMDVQKISGVSNADGAFGASVSIFDRVLAVGSPYYFSSEAFGGARLILR